MRPEISADGHEKRSFIEEARRAQIIEAAISTIADAGFSNASLARIAKQAGISKGVISYHFSGKDELMEQVVARVYRDVIEFVVPHVLESEDARSALRAHILSVAEYMQGHRDRFVALAGIYNGSRTAQGNTRYGVASLEPIYRSYEERFRAGQESGVFCDFDRRVMAVTLQSAIDGMFEYWYTYPEYDMSAHARELADHFDRATRTENRSG